jgi:ribonuclease Z
MVVPAQVWAMKMARSSVLPSPESPEVEELTTVQNSSHTPQGAFGYLLSQITPRPRLTVATHFPVADDTVACALKSVQAHCPDVEMGKDLVWSFDLMVLRVTKSQIIQLRGDVSDYGFSPTVLLPSGTAKTPKYHDSNGDGDPYAQIDISTEIPACEDYGMKQTVYNICNYREDGY